MAVRNADRLIDDATAAEKIGQICPVLPIRQSHMTELRKLETDEQRSTVWQDIVEHESTVTEYSYPSWLESMSSVTNWVSIRFGIVHFRRSRSCFEDQLS